MRRGIRELAIALFAFVLVGVAAAAFAAAHLLETPRGRPVGGEYHRLIHAAKAPLVGGRVELDLGPCPGHPQLAACVFTRRPRTIHMRRGLRDRGAVLYHELGHVFDFEVLNRSERRRFKRLMHVHRRRWYRGRHAPAELFADGYALCARAGPAIGSSPRRTFYGYRPSTAQHAAVCRLIAKAVDSGGAPPQRPRRPPPTLEESPPATSPPSPTDCDLLRMLLRSCS